MEHVMGKRPFMSPVFLRSKESKSGKYKAGNALEAIKYLENFWSSPRTGEYRRAKAICRSALDNLASAESARNYLIAAAERAGVLVRGRATSLIGPLPLS